LILGRANTIFEKGEHSNVLLQLRHMVNAQHTEAEKKSLAKK